MTVAENAIAALQAAADAYHAKIADINEKMNLAEADYQTKLAALGVRKYAARDTASRSYSTAWADGLVTDWWRMRGGVAIDISIAVPMRNESASWGGGYTELLYDVGDGWVSLGDSGYDGTMISGAANGILTYSREVLIDALSAEDYDVRFKFRHKSYDGTLIVNGLRDLKGEHFGTLLKAVC
ncbi:hypothetical protein [Grimontia marina]|uniref:Uncharacterized protein n=1 Tax=Grimontia marina TaxID=646534 RepID=A0A128EYS2_9GAMM|nr:hypothetical protein [Grimontia marina]CZF79732.1 hypothetical protein GMA8713_01106 [Grimontia marina]